MSGIIAISGKSGCGNSTVSSQVAERLGFRLVNYTFKNLAADEGKTFEEVMELSRTDDRWDHAVDRKQVELAKSADSVVGSRLAIWLLREIATLRVYLWASPEVRATRILASRPKEAHASPAYTRERDRSDHERYLRIYGYDNDEFVDADLILNTERFPPDALASLIVDAYKIRIHARALP